MLANVLAVLLGISSLIFYLVAFLYPEVHRRSDWVWSGLGLLYAVDLWFSAEQVTPVVLLGQVVAVTLLVGLGWQTLTVRREKTPVYQQTPIVLTPEVVGDWAKSKLNQLRIAPVETVRPATLKDRPVVGASTARLRQGLNQSLDPRRRPLYDYEFVEDGILDSVVPERPEISAEELEAFVSEAEAIDPPGAIAEVVTIQTDESSQPSLQSEDNEPKVLKAEATKPEASEVETPRPESLETKAVELGDNDWINELKPEEPPSEKLPLEELEDSDEWVNKSRLEESRLEEPQSEEPEPDKPELVRPQVAATAQIEAPKSEPLAYPLRQSPRERPSLLAMPIIVIGWLKDVAQSMTKPKPSKPVIDIPRREAPLPIETDDDDSNWID